MLLLPTNGVTYAHPSREPSDAPTIAAIYNQGIEERSSTFETTLRNPKDMLERLQASDRYPVLVLLNVDDQVIGWASLSVYRARACYDGIADFSIYLSGEVRGQGLGRHLLQALLKEAQARGFWKVLSAYLASTVPALHCAKHAVSAKWGCMRNMPALMVSGSTA